MESVVCAFTETDLCCGNVVFFNHYEIYKMKKRYKNLNDLKIVCMRYRFNFVYNFEWIRTKIKTNYIYEPELSLALIWNFESIKTYFYPTHCEVFIQGDISCLDAYCIELTKLLT